MEPKKAKRAIVITVIVALLLIALCLLFLFDVLPLSFQKSAEKPKTAAPSTATVSSSPGEETSEPEQTETEEGPSEKDLKGCSEKIYRPKAGSYLSDYVSMNVHADGNTRVYLQYRPEKFEGSSDVIMKMEKGAVVTALARENGYTLVKVQDGVAGWIESQYLENH